MSESEPSEKPALLRLFESLKKGRVLTPEQAELLATIKLPCC
jgi:hypothetical protein